MLGMARRATWLVLSLCVVAAGLLALADGSLHPALDAVADALWTAVFWLLVLVVLALLVWQVFPTPSR